MSGMQQWTIGLCAAAFAFSIVSSLTPSGALKKGVTALSGVVFFCCLLQPVGEIGAWISSVIPTSTAQSEVSKEVEELTYEQLLAATQSALEADAKRLLAEFDVTVSGVEIIRDTAQLDGIYIKSVRVVLDSSDHPVSPDVYTVLERAWSIPVEVWYDG